MPAWRGDGLLLAYAASPLAGGSFDIWTVDPAGGKPRRVVAGAAEQIAPSFGRDGKIAFQTLEPGEPFPEKTSDAGTPLVGPRELLPDFDQRAPFRLTIAGTKLGFASATDNVGDGPVWVRGSRPVAAGPMRAQQLVRMSDGSVRTYEDAGRLRYTPSPSHTHWHLLDFQRYELRTLDGELVVRDRKSGFCLADHYGLAKRRVTAFTGAHFFGNCAASNPQALSVEQGTSIGFTDLYPAHFHGQNLELRGVPAGIYLLVHRANPTLQLEELDYTNNAASLRIRLTWDGGAPRVRPCARAKAQPTARPSAAGSAKRSGRRSGSSSRRPSRSSRNASSRARGRPRCRPRRSRRSSPPPRARTPSSASACRKISGCGFVRPNAREPTTQSTSRPWWATNSSRSRLPFEIRPILTPCARSSASAGSASS